MAPDQGRIWCDSGCSFLQKLRLCPRLSPPKLPGAQQLSVSEERLRPSAGPLDTTLCKAPLKFNIYYYYLFIYILVNFILFLSSLNELCFTMTCKVKWVFLSMESGGCEASDMWLFLVWGEAWPTRSFVLIWDAGALVWQLVAVNVVYITFNISFNNVIICIYK